MTGALRRAAAALPLFATLAGAQAARPPRIQPELRADAIVARTSTVQAALGASVAAGRALRLELAAGAGPSWRRGVTQLGVRGDVVLRFLLDPDRVARAGFYGGAGVSVQHDPAERTRGYLALVAGVEGRARGAFVPFAEAGIGGGARIGVGVRRTVRGR